LLSSLNQTSKTGSKICQKDTRHANLPSSLTGFEGRGWFDPTVGDAQLVHAFAQGVGVDAQQFASPTWTGNLAIA
jgi:hypothetical protein